MVEGSGRLPGLCTEFSGLERRWYWRSERDHAASGLSEEARHERDLVFAALRFAKCRQRVRHSRLSQGDEGVRHHGGLRSHACRHQGAAYAADHDLVVNHSSDEHRWFVESRSSKGNPYRDYYFWREASRTRRILALLPPNNYPSFFSGSAWHATRQRNSFIALFAVKQPDLNWDNPKVREDVFSYAVSGSTKASMDFGWT